MDKFQLIDSIIVQVDALVDARGAEKCRTVLDVIGKLAVLKTGLKADDDEHAAAVAVIREEGE